MGPSKTRWTWSRSRKMKGSSVTGVLRHHHGRRHGVKVSALQVAELHALPGHPQAPQGGVRVDLHLQLAARLLLGDLLELELGAVDDVHLGQDMGDLHRDLGRAGATRPDEGSRCGGPCQGQEVPSRQLRLRIHVSPPLKNWILDLKSNFMTYYSTFLRLSSIKLRLFLRFRHCGGLNGGERGDRPPGG